MIGGDLARSFVADLWEHVRAECAGPDWRGRFVVEADFARHLEDGAEGVTLYGDEDRNGEFERIQAFCVEHRLTYLLTYDGCGGEWGPARRRWRPGDDEVGAACSLDADGGSACITDAEILATASPTWRRFARTCRRSTASLCREPCCRAADPGR